MKRKVWNVLSIVVVFNFILSLLISVAVAIPVGPSITVLSNTTMETAAATKINSTNGTSTPGGLTFTLEVTSVQKNTRWKGYVGNVSGSLTLDNVDGESVFQWSLGTIEGEVYATRSSGSINWSGVNCTWIADARENKTFDMINLTRSNRTPEHNENIELSHVNKFDNITATFAERNHTSLEVGSVTIPKDSCYAIQLWQNDTAQTFSTAETANFTQVILYDGAYNSTSGNVLYATNIEDDLIGYDGNETHDFQMILPEDGTPGFASSTAYYFYVELA